MTLGDRVAVMSQGKVHQVDRPEVIYSHPEDTFVATFIGSPEINLCHGSLVRKNGRLNFKGPGFFLDLEGYHLKTEEGEVEVGIRPEDIKIGEAGTAALKARVDMTSDMGSEKYVHACLGQESLTIRCPKDTAFQPGETIYLAVDPGRVHVFYKGLRV